MTPLVPPQRIQLCKLQKNLTGQIVLPNSYKNYTKRGYLRIIFGTSGVIVTAGAKIGDF
jgi:hypothetical protein